MKTLEFIEIVDNRIESIRKTLTNKAKEYAKDGDRFHIFNVAARINNITPEKALYGMMLKHMVSVADLIDMTTTGQGLTEKLIDEKIGDNINYLILLEGLLKERICANNP